MLDPIPLLCLVLLLWLVARDLSNKKSRPEPPLLPQHQNNVRYTVTLRDVEQQSVSEHQHQNEALPPKARYVPLEHEPVALPKPLQTVQLSAPSVSQERNQTPLLQVSPQQINEPVQQRPVLLPQLYVSSTEPSGQPIIGPPRQGAAQTYQVTDTLLVPNAGGEASQLPQDEVDEGSGDYVRLRERAKQEVEAIRKFRKEKKQARASGQSRLVEELTQEIKKHRKRRLLFDEQASSLIFAKNNKNGSLGRVDLHGLTADEAATHAKSAINDARERGITEIRFIVGKGLHSSGPPILKPSILKLMQKLKLPAKVDPSNEGVVVVQLAPASNASSPAVSQERDHTLLQPFLPLTSQLVQSPVLLPEIHLPSTEFDQESDDTSQGPVQNCQATPTPNADEEMSQVPQDSINNNAVNESDDSVIVRERAKQERMMMLSYRREKKLAQASGQMTLARELAKKENEYKERSELLNVQASQLIFAKNNRNGPLDWVVLHDLKAKEAKNFLKFVIQVARERGITELRLVVGEGSCAPDLPPLKPVIMKFLRKKRGLPVKVDPTNKGILVVAVSSESEI